jgi:leader peptidase (prepilin peptidase) / N-methyltransferase
MALALVFAGLFGLVIGSFLHVVVWRQPRGESLASPPSHCPHCQAPVQPRDNIPVLSWLLLRGRCRSCGEPISARYPLVELATAALYVVVVAAKWDDAADIALGLAFVTVLIPATLIDIDHRIIPNRLLAPFAILALVIAVALDRDFLVEQLIAALAGAGFFFLAVLVKPGGMGMGDVKLAGVMGLYLGRAVGPAIFIGMIVGALAGVVVIARKGAAAGRKTKIPFGPALAFGGLIGLFCGDAIADAYLDTF